MNDAYFRDKLSAYLDNQLPPDERLIVEQYLAAHPEAQKELEELRQFTAMVDQQAELRDDLYWEKSAQKIEEKLGFGKAKAPKEKESGWQWTPFRVSAMIATAASLVLVAYIGFKDREHIEQRVEEKTTKVLYKGRNDSISKYVDSAELFDSISKGVDLEGNPIPIPPPVAPPEKSQTTDKRPQLATDKDVKEIKDSAVSLKAQESVADETAGASQQFAAPAPSASPKMAEQEASKKETAESPMALSAESPVRAAEEDLARTTTDEIGQLLHQRDSLYALLKKEKSKIGKVNSLTQESKPSLFKSSTPAEQMSLLTVWYQLARQSSDSSLKQQSIDSLTKYSTGTDQQLRKQAQEYLDSLAADKPDSGR